MLSFWDQVLITSSAVLGAAAGSSLLSIRKCLAVPTTNKPVQSSWTPLCIFYHAHPGCGSHTHASPSLELRLLSTLYTQGHMLSVLAGAL